MRRLLDFVRVLAIALWAMLGGVALAACTAGTEPSTNPREQRTDPDDTGRVSGRVITSGTRSSGSREEAEADDSTTGRGRHQPVSAGSLRRCRRVGRPRAKRGRARTRRSAGEVRGDRPGHYRRARRVSVSAGAAGTDALGARPAAGPVPGDVLQHPVSAGQEGGRRSGRGTAKGAALRREGAEPQAVLRLGRAPRFLGFRISTTPSSRGCR